MNRAINDLLQARAKAVTDLQALASKRAGAPLDAAEIVTFNKIKADITDYDATIADLKKLDNDNGYSATIENEKPLANFIKYGWSEGLTAGVMDKMKAASRLGIPMAQQDRSGFSPVVPVEFETMVWTKAKESSVLMQLAKRITCGSGSKDIPIGNADTTAYFRAENGTYSDSSATLTKKTLTAYNLYCLSKISKELLEDAIVDVEAYTAENQGAVIGEKIDTSFFGNAAAVSATSPKGLFDDMTAQVMFGATLTYKDINKMYMGLKQAYRKNGAWVAPSTFITAVMDLVDDVGRPIFMPSYDVGKPDRLLGKPIYEVSSFGNVTIGGVDKAAQAVFADWSNIAFGERRGITMTRLVELYAGNGQIGLISDARLDACVVISEAARILHAI